MGGTGLGEVYELKRTAGEGGAMMGIELTRYARTGWAVASRHGKGKGARALHEKGRVFGCAAENSLVTAIPNTWMCVARCADTCPGLRGIKREARQQIQNEVSALPPISSRLPFRLPNRICPCNWHGFGGRERQRNRFSRHSRVYTHTHR